MRSFCLNHMTTPTLSFPELVELAAALGCSGIEVRNDLDGQLFDGLAPETAKVMAADQSVQIMAIAEVAAFNDGSERALDQLTQLADIASRCGAKGISLIPSLASDQESDSLRLGANELKDQLNNTLANFAPVLEQHQLIGFVEPLGFKRASLRFKADIVALIKAAQLESTFRLVHDTFHHHLANESELFPEHTGMVHVSGATSMNTASKELCDAQRGLVDDDDTLGNLEQLTHLSNGGYQGPISIEAFAPAVHNLQDPKAKILACLNHINSSLQVVAA